MIKSCLGLDVGSYQLKIAEIVKQGRNRYRINALIKYSLPEGIEDPEHLSGSLRKILNRAGIKTQRVVLGLNTPQMTIKQITMPRMQEKELDQAIMLDLVEILKLPNHNDAADIYYSYDVINAGSELSILVVGCPKAVLDPYIIMMKGAGLVPCVIDVSAFNLSHAVNQGRGLRTCYVDFGHSQTVIYVETHGVYTLYRILPIGGIHLDEAIAQALAVDVAEAHKLKCQLTLEEILQKGSGSKTLLRTVFQQYIGGLYQTFNYLRSVSRAAHIDDVLDQVVICGGIAHLPGFDALLKQELDIDVWRLNPLEGYELADGLQGMPDYGVFANAIGLAMRGLND